MIYFNDNDQFVARWLTNLYPSAVIDDRSIDDIRPDDLVAYQRAHFFAGIGLWEYALALAGWPSDIPVWTGSCPCQPFSAAGSRRGAADQRHLWPAWYRLIAECRPGVIFGEQVDSADGRIWLAGVQADLEAAGYAVGAASLNAAGVGAPHIRQRLYWVAYADQSECRRRTQDQRRSSELVQPPDGRAPGGLADSHDGRPHPRGAGPGQKDGGWPPVSTSGCSQTRGLADADGRDARDGDLPRGGQYGQQPSDDGAGGLEHSASNGRVDGGPNQAGGALPHDASLVGWPTPNAMLGGQTSRGGDRSDEALMGGIVRGLTPDLSSAPTAAGGAFLLNPSFSRWLLGVPAEWESFAPTATRSRQRSPPSSS